ncbi:amino acid adenylation domain-containing protein [Amycolatopsis sp. NBC_00348]|uniref:non-ribosomal peptide synthetase n=1 Tax=Amycolatopsis sp. NBC_00348 TaxID=2975956 RepID=UPI002E27661E|nr:non-ribosomal peptide synthetase [Amycolatopsis sp. NBC_00348]
MEASPLEDILPLSPMQEGMLFHSLLDPDGGVDFEQLLYRFDGPLDTAALERAWQSVVARHTALRARLRWQGVDRPLQLIERSVTVPVTVLGRVPSDGLEAWLAQDRREGISLAKAPLLRVTLFRETDREHLMVLSFHHVLLDGWSVRLVLRDLMTCYRAESEGRRVVLEPAPQYRSFLRWLGAQDTAAAERYWKGELADFTAPTKITADRPGTESGFAVAELELDAAESARVREFARAQRITVNTVLQGALALVLSRYTGERDVVFGATMSTRPPEADRVESMVGLMINTLPLRVRVEPAKPVGEWLRSVQDAQLRLRQYDYTPLVLAQSSSGVPQGTPLFESLLVFENYPAASAADQSAGGVELVPVGARERNGYPLSVVAAVRDLLRVEITYDRARFDRHRAGLLAGHLRTLLLGLAADPAALVGDLGILTPAERQLIVTEWNATDAGYPADRCVHELFAACAARDPGAVAVVDTDGTRLTYGELDARANRLAHHLRGLGAGPEQRIGICVSPSVNALVGIFGILKSGAAYVPLDPGHPAERMRFMLDDTGAEWVLVEPRTRPGLPAEYAERAIVLDADVSVAAGLPETDPGAPVRADNLAYVMYTSGSTGRPKGVLVAHQGLVNYLWWAIDGYGLGGASGAPMLGSIAFDLSMPNFFLPLIGGKDVTLLAADRGHDSLRELLAAPGDFSLLKITPGHLDLLRGMIGEDEQLGSVRTYVVGADEVKPETLAAWQRIAPKSRVINEYGPTETVVGCSIYVADERFDPSVPVPIGRPIANTRMYVLDEALNPVPVGVVGELCIGGDGVARGYLGRPDITAERFVPDPFGPGRLYRTGDLARFRPDGDLEFLGRTDHQVKIRGYRVELGEIEARLLLLDAVSEAVVVAREDTPGDRRLVAYLVADGDLTEPAVREWVAAVLPGYMLPAAFVFLPALPLSGNGKVDRRGLPAPGGARPELAAGPVRPRTPSEELVAGVWSDVLGIDEIGVYDDFFALGGHSLLATQVVSRLSRLGGAEVPLRALFADPTVADLARLLDERRTGRRIPPIERVAGDGDLFPLSFAQQRLWLLDQLEPGSTEYVVPLAWRLTGTLDVAALETALGGVIARHEVLRTTFAAGETEAGQRIHPARPVGIPVFDVGVEALDDAIRGPATKPFDLVTGPVWRTALFRVAADDHVLLFATHHIAMDAWSARNLVRELGEGYRAALRGTAPETPAPAVRYADFAVWQRNWLRGDVLDEQLGYWREQLTGVPPLQLPTDRPRAAVRSTEGASLEFSMPAELAAGLRGLARDHRTTLFMVILAGVQLVLGRYAGQTDVAVGTPIAGRNRREVEGLIGFFVNTLVLRTDLGGDPRFAELLDRVREVTMGAYEHQDLPFERLVEELQPERDFARTPLFQVMLSVNTVPAGEWELPGVHTEEHGFTTGQAKFDLTLAFADTPGGLLAGIRYSTALFDAERVRRLSEHVQRIFSAVVADPKARLSDLSLLSEAEHESLVHGRNADRTSHVPAGVTGLHRLFEQQAAARPDAVALAGPAELTYAEVDRRADALAARLRERGAGPEVFVGICLPRSAEAVICALAVAKTGAAFVPIDARQPRDRVAFILEDTGTGLVLTDAATAAGALTGFRGEVLLIGGDDDAAESRPVPPAAIHPGNAAYVVYTSGSTGRPKGVVATHGNALARIGYLRDEYGIGPADTGITLSGWGFDASVREIFVALSAGAKLVVTDPDAAKDPASVVALLAGHRVSTILSVVPTLLYELAAQPVPDAGLAAVRLVLCSGEHLYAERLAECAWLAGKVVNQFGPTETTMTATRIRVPAGAGSAWTYPVGEPMAGTEVYVLDAAMAPCPAGVPGELYIGGAGVSRGYWDRPGLTAERFLPNPFGDGRLYRTGDLCRWGPGQVLEHLGRTDHQVKIRGFRVELDEIGTHLRALDAVAEAVVVAREDEPGDQRLVAYVVPAGTATTVPQLRASLEESLPEYQIPARFVLVPALPKTANGKIDRLALPDPDSARPELGAGFAAPRTELETAIAAIWHEVLGLDRVGVFDDFFDLGGHSLLAAHVVARLRARHDVKVPLRAIFEARTVAGLAELAAAEQPTATPGLVPLNTGPRDRTLFCVHEGTGSVTGYYALARALEPDFALVGLDFDESLVTAAAPDQVVAMAEVYVERIRRWQPAGPYRLCGWSFGGIVAYEAAAQLLRAGAEVSWVGLVDSVVQAPETRQRHHLDGLLDEMIAVAEGISEADWTGVAPRRLTDLVRQAGFREEQIGLGKDALESVLRRNRFFRMAKRNYRPRPADVPLTVLKATDGNWSWPWFEAWREHAPRTALLEVPGTHLSVLEEPQLAQVVSVFRAGLEAAG